MSKSLEFEPGHKEVSPESIEKVINSLDNASKLTISERFKFIMNDPKCKESYEALSRTLINTGISAVDIFPVAGDAAEGVVLGLKISPWIKGQLANLVKNPKKLEKHFDLTPDISAGQAMALSAATAPVEFLGGGTVPTYLINTLWQLKADIQNKRFDGAVDSMKVLFTGTLDKMTPENNARLDSARKVFK